MKKYYLIGLIFSLLFTKALAQNPLEKRAPSDLEKTPTASDNVDKYPEPLNMREVANNLKYPADCKKEKIEGKVMVKLLVDQNGKTVKHEILRAPDARLAKACEAEVYALKFTPALRGDKAVDCWVTIPFKFELPNENDKN